MSDAVKNFWRECIEVAADECSATLTPEQVEYIAGAAQGGHENYGMAFHQPRFDEHPVFAEKKRLEQELRRERELIHCRRCDGRGREISQGPYHSSNSQCSKCGGNGRHAP